MNLLLAVARGDGPDFVHVEAPGVVGVDAMVARRTAYRAVHGRVPEDDVVWANTWILDSIVVPIDPSP